MKLNKIKRYILVIIAIIAIILIVRAINSLQYKAGDIPASYLSSGLMSEYSLEQEGITINPVRDGYLNALHMVPNQKTSKGLVVTFNGSGRGCDYDRSVKLAKQGYEVMAMFYFAEANQPPNYNNVPVEFFSQLLEYCDQNNIDTEELTIIGTSKGAELSLVLLNYYANEIDNAVLFAPSAYVFQGGDMMAKTSSWSYDGKELPYISLFPNFINGVKMVSALLFNYPLSYRAHHMAVVKAEENIEAVEIDFSKFEGDLLVFAGDDDALWHSDIMGQIIKDKAEDQTELIIYPGAGHVFLPVVNAHGMAFGGTLQANKVAQVHSDKTLLEYLAKNHKVSK